MSFTSFSCLITMARTSNSVLSRRGKNGHPCLVTDYREYWYKTDTYQLSKFESSKINPYTWSQLIYDKGGRNI